MKLFKAKKERPGKVYPGAYIGREILPGVVVHLTDDADPETIKALQEMFTLLQKQIDEGKIGKPRKAKK